METETKHAATPWYTAHEREDAAYVDKSWVIRETADPLVRIATVHDGRLASEQAGNAEFIVRSVNTHDDLVAALEVLVDTLAGLPVDVPGPLCEPLHAAEKALAKAKGTPCFAGGTP